MGGQGAYLSLQSRGIQEDPMPATRRSVIIGALAVGLIAAPFTTASVAWADAPDSAFSIRGLDDGAAKPSGEMLISAAMVQSAYPATDADGRLAIRFEFNDEGRRRLADYTTANVGRRVAFVANGEILAAPVIRDPMTGGKAEITGHFSDGALRTLAAAFPDPRWASVTPR